MSAELTITPILCIRFETPAALPSLRKAAPGAPFHLSRAWRLRRQHLPPPRPAFLRTAHRVPAQAPKPTARRTGATRPVIATADHRATTPAARTVPVPTRCHRASLPTPSTLEHNRQR